MKKLNLSLPVTLLFFMVSSLYCIVSAQPANDKPCDAIEMKVNETILYGQTNVGATVDSGEQAIAPTSGDCDVSWCEGDVDNSVWFKFIAIASTTDISTCGLADFDTQLAVYAAPTCGSFSSYTLMGANDDGPISCTDDYDSYLSLDNTIPGSEYYILLDGYDGEAGTFDIGIISPPTNEAPQYDTPCNSLLIDADGSINHTYYNLNATVSTGEDQIAPTLSDCANGWCELDINNSVWFWFYAPSTTVEISTCGMAEFDTQIALYHVTSCSDFNSFTLLDANDDCDSGYSSFMISEGLTVGLEYYILVDGYNGDEGYFDLTVSPASMNATKEVIPAEDIFKLSPNPTSGQVTIQLENPNEEQQVIIRDLQGRNVFYENTITANSDNVDLDIAHLSAGVYLVQVRNETGVYTQRLVLQK